MLKKSLSLIITFQDTTQAMAAERYLEKAGLPGRLIPVPREITAGCGLAWKAAPDAREAVCAALDAENIRWHRAHIVEV